ncbi:MAG TPA: hypothetical protein ENN46_03665 [Candidatus Woesearchaeota archaeon]|nr:hypothetical protein [Candidatus Woesearchaeota archaeon]
MNAEKELRECFRAARKLEEKGMKHKGLITVPPDTKEAKQYLEKARRELRLCGLYRKEGFDYKLPEEWFYTLYYCALSILARIGVESRSQKYTALLLEYLKQKELVSYDYRFIQMIKVHSRKEEESEVDRREYARYSSAIRIEEVEERYERMMDLCREAISQAEEIVYFKDRISMPKEISE